MPAPPKDFVDDYDPSSRLAKPYEWLQVKGSVEVEAFADDELQQPLWYVGKKNLVVLMARRIMSRLLGGAANSPTITTAGGPVAISSINQLLPSFMKWGIAGHDPLSPTTDLPVNVLLEGLTSPVLVAGADDFKSVSVDYPTDRSVRFTATLLKAEPVTQPVDLSEEGLFCGVSSPEFLFAKVNYGQLSKTNTIALRFRHTIVM